MKDKNEILSSATRIAEDIARKHAADVDKKSEFPRAVVDAMRDAGLLGLVSAESVGGLGGGPAIAAEVVERLARECASSAMVIAMHYAATAVIEKLGPEGVRRGIASGEHFTTLAFSEAGSRGQFWAPVSSASEAGGKVKLNARKSWVTSAHEARSYVWSSKPLAGSEASTLWLVPADTKGLRIAGGFDGLGLRGNDSCPVTAEDAQIDSGNRLGNDGGGFKWMLELVLPWFNLMNAATAVGLMEAATARTAAHASGTGFEHSGTKIADLPTVRAYIARMRVKTDMARALWLDSLAAVESARADAVLRVLESKVACGETANEVVDLAMRVSGGAAFRKDVGVERIFRDARASQVMAPTSDVLYEFIGRAVCNMPLF